MAVVLNLLLESGLINVIHSAGGYFACNKAKGRRKPSGFQELATMSGAK
jgi:Fe2+ or Zn2+ uptake regulation protein